MFKEIEKTTPSCPSQRKRTCTKRGQVTCCVKFFVHSIPHQPPSSPKEIYIHIHEHTCVCAHKCMCVYRWLHNTCVYPCVYVCTNVYIGLSVNMHANVCIYVLYVYTVGIFLNLCFIQKATKSQKGQMTCQQCHRACVSAGDSIWTQVWTPKLVLWPTANPKTLCSSLSGKLVQGQRPLCQKTVAAYQVCEASFCTACGIQRSSMKMEPHPGQVGLLYNLKKSQITLSCRPLELD